MKTSVETTYTPRHLERVLSGALKTFPSLIITGPRQVGKTTLLNNTLKDSYTYTSLDDLVLRGQAQNEPALFLQNNPGNLIIDEVQYAPDLFPYLKIEIDRRNKKGQFVLSGSQKYSLMQGASESLAGRIAILELQGYSLRELEEKPFYPYFIPTESYVSERGEFESSYQKSRQRQDPTDHTANIWNQIHRGMLPALQDPAINWEQYYSAYVQTYIERDVKQITRVENELQFRQFLTAMAARDGEMLNYSNVSRDVGVSVDTIKRWTSILQASGIILLLQPYHTNALSRAIKTPKLHFFDTGLVCYLTGWLTPEVLQKGAKAGSIFESFAVMEIVKSWQYAGRDIRNFYYYRDKQGREIDLLIMENGIMHPIEIKMTAHPKISMTKAFEILDAVSNLERGLGALVCQYEKPLYLSESVVALPLSYL